MKLTMIYFSQGEKLFFKTLNEQIHNFAHLERSIYDVKKAFSFGPYYLYCRQSSTEFSTSFPVRLSGLSIFRAPVLPSGFGFSRREHGGGKVPFLAVGRGVYGSAPASSIGSLPALVPGIGLSCHKPRGDPPRAAVGDLRVPSPPRPAEIITTPGPGQKKSVRALLPLFSS